MHEMSNLFSGGRKQNISKWHLLKFLKITHKVTADQVMQLCYAFFCWTDGPYLKQLLCIFMLPEGRTYSCRFGRSSMRHTFVRSISLKVLKVINE